MFKKVLSVFLALVTVFCFASCSGGNPTVEEVSNPSSSVPETSKYMNNLTGIEDSSKPVKELRPVAVMVNNIGIAQSVQTGVPSADIVYETEVEGGITRLLAVYKDASVIKKIGSIRSARYVYVDLALGHDAIYIHHGQDPVYAAPYLSSSGVADFNIDSPYAFRQANGLSSEHTLYSDGEKINNGIAAKNIKATTEKTENFANFRKATEKVAPTFAKAVSASVPFSSSATSVFTYNEETGLYTKNTKGRTNKDYTTGEAYEVTNVFILSTTISAYPDGYHMWVDLNSGSGYYMSAGGYEPITWKKGEGSASFKFYAQDGSELKVNAGKSWVCIHSSNFTPTFSES